jgi:hypothetical protein
MPVTDDQAAALRALLVHDQDRHKQLFGQLDRAEARKGYPALVTAAFGEAVERRFGQRYQAGDVVTFVADVRARSDRLAAQLDPGAAERVINAVLGHGSIRDLDRESVLRAKLVLLAALVADAALDEFLAAARKLADSLIY